MITGGIAAVTLSLAACGSSKSSTTSGTNKGTPGGHLAVTVGVIADLTGASASGFVTTEQGIKAGVGVARSKGVTIHYVMADTASSPAGALAATQSLVNNDHVTAIVENTAYFFGAAQYLFSQHIPVVGGGFDGPEWASPKLSNLFDTAGSADYTKVATTFGTFFKQRGVTTVGVIGGSVPSSLGAADEAALSAKAAGLKVGYENLNVPIGTTDVQPIAIAMKSAGVDGLFAPEEPATNFALGAALAALGVHPKAFVLATGYGGDLLSSPAGVQAAQGLDFDSVAEPVEMNTTATQQFRSALKAYAGTSAIPTFAEYEAYIDIAALADGLSAAGASPTATSLSSAIRNETSFNAWGLFGSHSVNFSAYGTVVGGLGPDNCAYITRLTGSAFKLLSGATPVCGTIIPGLTARTSS